MTEPVPSLDREYFDRLYAENPDPWGFESSAYEREKYALTLARLPRAHYHSAIEVGCSIGVLTRQLAGRADAVTGIDIAPAAIASARARNADLPQLEFAALRVPHDWPAGSFDLIVLSEVIYFLSRADMLGLAQRVRGCARPGADICMVHWLAETGYPMTGDEAADGFIAACAGFAAITHQERHAQFRLDALRVDSAEAGA